MDKRRSYIPEHQRIIILSGLIRRNSGVGAVGWAKIVLPDVGDASREREEESLDRDYVHRGDTAIAIHISSR